MVQEISSTLPSVAEQMSAASFPGRTKSDRAQEKLKVELPLIKKVENKQDPIELQKNLAQSIERLNKMMLQNGRNLSFTIDPSFEIPIITVRNEQTGEIVRQIPTQAVVSVAHNFDALKGILLNAKI
jgi:flagellar protein FlaG